MGILSPSMAVVLRCLVVFIAAIVRDRADLVAENLVLRQQLAALAHGRRRPRIRPVERFAWGVLSRHWGRRRELLVIVKPATVVA